MPSTVVTAVVRERIEVHGVVQGVGFRPFVHRLARSMALDGWVANDAGGVVAEVQGDPDRLELFARRLLDDAPPAARVTAVSRSGIEVAGGGGFLIAPSRRGGPARTEGAPDLAICDDCRRELLDPTDRRHRHPFISCVHCGPRFTVTTALPYDRSTTTMAGFAMCERCRHEYGDPSDRRHHAQTVCCHDCGPRLGYERADGSTSGTTGSGGARSAGDRDALAAAVADLVAGRVVAVKGIGGWHLACRADDDAAVARLRRRKGRPDKPLAVMVADLAAARRLGVLDDVEAATLQGPARPIVLLARRPTAALSDHVAPGLPWLGLFLPYTPLHVLLLEDGPGPLVLTSANVAGSPIVHDDHVARRTVLGRLADGLLGHDRPIVVPCDDSVVRVVDGEPSTLRRSRGFCPLPLALPAPVPPTLGVGGDLKAAFCLAEGRAARMSQHLGDLTDPGAVDGFERSVDHLGRVGGAAPVQVAADRHPGYASRRWAEARFATVAGVQHHRAHVAAVMAEHGVGPDVEVAAVAFDGTGYGDDGAIWGGEVFRGTYRHLRRVGHLAPVLLPGGDAAIRRPARVALAYLRAAALRPTADLAPVAALGPHETAVVLRQLETGFNCVPTTSMGRLFDAAASLLGLRHLVTYEAQAAIELEAAATGWNADRPELTFPIDADGVADPAPVVRGLVEGRRAGTAVGALAAAFHDAVAELVAGWATRIDRPVVVLSGGVFQNAVLVQATRHRLEEAGFTALVPRSVPANDGSLALGQVVLAAVGGGEG